MKEYSVAVLGATGAVGREMIRILEERNFPVKKLVPLASARSAGTKLMFRGEEVAVSEACPTSFTGVDLVLGAAPNKLAREFAPYITAAGAVFEPCIFLAGYSFFVAGYRRSMQKTCRFIGRRALWYPFAEKNTKMARRKEPWIIATPP